MNKFVTQKSFVKLFFMALDLALQSTTKPDLNDVFSQAFEHKVKFETPMLIKIDDKEYSVGRAYLRDSLVQTRTSGKFIHQDRPILFASKDFYILINVKGEVNIHDKKFGKPPTCDCCYTVVCNGERCWDCQEETKQEERALKILQQERERYTARTFVRRARVDSDVKSCFDGSLNRIVDDLEKFLFQEREQTKIFADHDFPPLK